MHYIFPTLSQDDLLMQSLPPKSVVFQSYYRQILFPAISDAPNRAAWQTTMPPTRIAARDRRVLGDAGRPAGSIPDTWGILTSGQIEWLPET